MRAILVCSVLALAAGSVRAGEPLRVDLQGAVLVNQMQFIASEPMGSVAPGQPVTLTFEIDSDAFLPSDDGTARAYAVDSGSFELILVPGSLSLKPRPTRRPPWLVLNDGATSDGAMLSEAVASSHPLTLDFNGALGPLTQYVELTFEPTEFSSPDALSLLGTHGTSGLLDARWEYEDVVFIPLVIGFETLTVARAGALAPEALVEPPAASVEPPAAFVGPPVAFVGPPAPAAG